MVPEDHTKYVNPKLFEVQEGYFSQTSNEGNSSLVANELKSEPVEQELKSEPSFKGIPYTSIISEWWRRNGGEPAEGERNVKLHKLAVNLRAICDNKKEVLMQVMPRFGLSDVELKSVVDSACKEEPKGISKVMQGIIDALELGINPDEIEDAEAVAEETGVKVNVKALPIGLKESLVGVPVSMHMPVLCGIMPMLATGLIFKRSSAIRTAGCCHQKYHRAVGRRTGCAMRTGILSASHVQTDFRLQSNGKLLDDLPPLHGWVLPLYPRHLRRTMQGVCVWCLVMTAPAKHMHTIC